MKLKRNFNFPGDLGFPGLQGQCFVKIFNSGEEVNGICFVGPPGMDGRPGNPGLDGLPGFATEKGDRGSKGERGIDGLPGKQGTLAVFFQHYNTDKESRFYTFAFV